MSDQAYGEFIVKIIETLRKNGYPERQVALPLEKMYESAHNRGINFNKVLEFLKTKEDIAHRKTDEKIIFYPSSQDMEAQAEGDEPLNFQELSQLFSKIDMSDPSSIIKQSQELLGKLPPEQLQKLMGMFNSLTDEKKEEILKKGKDMGIIPD